MPALRGGQEFTLMLKKSRKLQLQGVQGFILLSIALADGCFGLLPAVFNGVVDNMNNVNDLSKYIRKLGRN